MAYTGYKIFLNRRRLILDPDGDIYYNGLTWSSDLTEPNSDVFGNFIPGQGPFFDKIPDATCVNIERLAIDTSLMTHMRFENITSTVPFTIFWDEANNISQSYASGTFSAEHTYSSPFTGQIIIETQNLSGIKRIEIQPYSNVTPLALTPYSANSYDYPFSIADSEIYKLDGLQELIIKESGLVNASTLSFSRYLTRIDISYADVYGSLDQLPLTLGYLRLEQVTPIYGNVIDFKTINASFSSIFVGGNNTISGDIGDLPVNCQELTINGLNTISGNLVSIPGGSVSSPLSSFRVGGYNIIHGDLSSMNWNNLLLFSISSASPHGVTAGYITGNIDNITFRPDMTGFSLFGGINDITGNVSQFSKNLSSLSVSGNSSFYGSVGNTLYGNLSDLPHTNMRELSLVGKNEVTGSLDTYGTASNLYIFIMGGSSSISGDLSDVPPNTSIVELYGYTTVATYSTSRSWGGTRNMTRVVVDAAVNTIPFTASDINRILIDLDSYNWSDFSSISKSINLRGPIPISGPELVAYNSLYTKLGGNLTITP